MYCHFFLLLYSIRPSACLGVALFAVAAYQDTSDPLLLTIIFGGAFSGAASCFLINDLHDIEKDLLNEKQRPIATGRLPKNQVIYAIVIFLTAYIWLSIFLGTISVIICLATTLIFFTYSKINHAYGFFANITVAVCVVLSFLYGGSLVQFDDTLILLTISTFFVIVSREIMLDVLDKKGDLMFGKSSIPLSKSNNIVITIIFIGYLLGTVPLLFLMGEAWILTISISTMLAILWLPLLMCIFLPRLDWMLFNIRSSHGFFGLLIAILFLR